MTGLRALAIPAICAGIGLAASGCATAPAGAPVQLDGATVLGPPLRLSNHRGEPVVLAFWATWCGPCVGEAGVLAAAAARLEPTGVLFVGIAEESPQSAVRAFLRRHRVTYPTLDDPGGSLRRSLGGPSALPETVILDGAHRVRDRLFGPLTPSSLNAAVAGVGPPGARARDAS